MPENPAAARRLPLGETVFMEIQIPMKDLIVFTRGQGPGREDFAKLGHVFREDCKPLLGTPSQHTPCRSQHPELRPHRPVFENPVNWHFPDCRDALPGKLFHDRSGGW